MLHIRVGDLLFQARFEDQLAPRTCAAFRAILPLRATLLQARWSGEAAWVPLGDLDLGVPVESGTQRPTPGQLLFYPKGLSETEILVPYGATVFGSKAGPLVGSHFLTVVSAVERLPELGRRVLYQGAMGIYFDL